MVLSDDHVCSHCGLILDRDVNAAHNILRAIAYLRKQRRDKAEQVVLVRTCSEPFILNPCSGGSVLLEQAQGEATQDGEVLGTVIFTQAAFIFAEGDTQISPSVNFQKYAIALGECAGSVEYPGFSASYGSGIVDARLSTAARGIRRPPNFFQRFARFDPLYGLR